MFGSPLSSRAGRPRPSGHLDPQGRPKQASGSSEHSHRGMENRPERTVRRVVPDRPAGRASVRRALPGALCVEAQEQMRAVDLFSGFAWRSERQVLVAVDAGPGIPDASEAKPVAVAGYALASTRTGLR